MLGPAGFGAVLVRRGTGRLIFADIMKGNYYNEEGINYYNSSINEYNAPQTYPSLSR